MLRRAASDAELAVVASASLKNAAVSAASAGRTTTSLIQSGRRGLDTPATSWAWKAASMDRTLSSTNWVWNKTVFSLRSRSGSASSAAAIFLAAAAWWASVAETAKATPASPPPMISGSSSCLSRSQMALPTLPRPPLVILPWNSSGCESTALAAAKADDRPDGNRMPPAPPEAMASSSGSRPLTLSAEMMRMIRARSFGSSANIAGASSGALAKIHWRMAGVAGLPAGSARCFRASNSSSPRNALSRPPPGRSLAVTHPTTASRGMLPLAAFFRKPARRCWNFFSGAAAFLAAVTAAGAASWRPAFRTTTCRVWQPGALRLLP